MFNKAPFIFLVFFVFLCWQNSPAVAQSLSFLDESTTYMWPTNASHQLSSTFAETRSRHLHAGIDIRTWGREGYDVYATRDGVVHRVAMGPTGYGNVIYLKHNDGSYSVYAHLNRFEPDLQAYVDSIRMIDYSFDFDEIIEDKNFTFNQGDVIAYTGSTGVGPPHLHFELRTPEFKPFNPLLTNIGVQDDIPPVFRQLGIEFLDSETLHLNGHKIVNANSTSTGYDFGTITAVSPIGLSVNVHDRANHTPNVYAVHTLTMVHESDTLFHSQADYFSYRDTGHMFLDRSYPILAQTRNGFQRLYTVEGNRLPFYRVQKNRGVLNFPEGQYPLKIIAADIYGNETTASVDVHFESSTTMDEITYVPVYPRRDQTKTISGFSFNRVQLTGTTPLLTTTENNQIPFLRNPKPATFHSLHSVQKKLTPGKKSTLETPDKKLWVKFPNKALYDTLDLQMNVSQTADEIHISFDPNRLPIEGSVQLNYILPEAFRNNTRLAVFSMDRYRDRKFRINSTNSHGIIRASMREISDLIIKEDRTAPWVGRPRLENNLAGNPIVIVPARDDLTGINFRKSTITVNDQKGIVEYDPEKDFLIFYNPNFTPADTNVVEVRVFDGVGNSTIRSFTI